jgi:hypothetical protein
MKILLSSVFGPFGVDDEYGRKENIVELFHNQVTREQGLFSLRLFHPSSGLHFIAENLRASTKVLDFPTQKRFIKELSNGYDYVGISFITPNFAKARRMAELVRRHAPKSRIVLGGHGTRIPGIEQLIDCDHICRGEGVAWFRELLGEVPRPLKHPLVPASFSNRIAGSPFPNTSGVLIPGVGCPNACRFCATSHFFDKKYTSFFSTGRELFEVCERYERELGITEFFVMDENFLKRPGRVRELAACMEEKNKHYRFGIFSSAETVQEVGVEFMARLGVHFIWLGVESKQDTYEKNKGIDLKAMIKALRDHGINVLASGILFLEHHDKETIWEDVRYVVDMEADFTQFMQLGPMPQTALYKDYAKKGLLRDDVPYEEWHGQHRLWFRHPEFTGEESERYLRDAFKYEYDQLGSSMLRMCDTAIRGYETMARYDDPYMKRRRQQLKELAMFYRPILGVLKTFGHNPAAKELAEAVAEKYTRQLGPPTLKQRITGVLAKLFALKELARLRQGRTAYQPKTFETTYKPRLKELVRESLSRSREALTTLDISWPPKTSPVLISHDTKSGSSFFSSPPRQTGRD